MLQFYLCTYRILKSLNILQFDSDVLSLSGVAIPRTGMATPRMMRATSKTFAPLFCECTAPVAFLSFSVPSDVSVFGC